jgi:capsular polysaccharide transport system permease protein
MDDGSNRRPADTAAGDQEGPAAQARAGGDDAAETSAEAQESRASDAPRDETARGAAAREDETEATPAAAEAPGKDAAAGDETAGAGRGAVGAARPEALRTSEESGAEVTPVGPRKRQVGRRKGPAQGAAKSAPSSILVDVQSEELARRARRRRIRDRIALWLSFVLLVAAPSGVAAWYLNDVAADQYASEVGFAVRSLDGTLPSPMTELLGGAADSTAGDSQMLFEYLQSQPLVERVDAEVDLREIYNRPEADSLFALGEDRTIEELVEYWNLAVTVSYDTGSGVIYGEVRAFRPEDARDVAASLLEESGRLINSLSENARQDAVRFARIDLEEAEQRVREARMALQAFRGMQGTADVSGDISQEMQLIAELRRQRSALQADYDSRKELLGEDSPTLSALRRRISSLDAQIVEAEARIADGSEGSAATVGPGRRAGTLAEAAGLQEELQVELELATNMYTAAQAGLESARADARRAQRYLATHISPTLAQEPRYPRRVTWSVAIFVVLLLGWAILMLIVSSIRDRH